MKEIFYSSNIFISDNLIKKIIKCFKDHIPKKVSKGLILQILNSKLTLKYISNYDAKSAKNKQINLKNYPKIMPKEEKEILQQNNNFNIIKPNNFSTLKNPNNFNTTLSQENLIKKYENLENIDVSTKLTTKNSKFKQNTAKQMGKNIFHEESFDLKENSFNSKSENNLNNINETDIKIEKYIIFILNRNKLDKKNIQGEKKNIQEEKNELRIENLNYLNFDSFSKEKVNKIDDRISNNSNYIEKNLKNSKINEYISQRSKIKQKILFHCKKELKSKNGKNKFISEISENSEEFLDVFKFCHSFFSLKVKNLAKNFNKDLYSNFFKKFKKQNITPMLHLDTQENLISLIKSYNGFQENNPFKLPFIKNTNFK